MSEPPLTLKFSVDMLLVTCRLVLAIFAFREKAFVNELRNCKA